VYVVGQRDGIAQLLFLPAGAALHNRWRCR
jgi:hypothetical protein